MLINLLEDLKVTDGFPYTITESVSLSPDLTLSPTCAPKLHSSTALRGVDWCLLTDASDSISVSLTGKTFALSRLVDIVDMFRYISLKT